MSIMDAAAALIKQLNAPAAMHSVWVQTRVDNEGNFKPVLMVSIRPSYKSKVQVPKECLGFEVVQEPWPKGG